MKRKSSMPSSSSNKTDRKTIERNRRNNMKALYSQLNSLVPLPAASSTSGEPLTLPDQIDEATKYIQKKLEDIEKLKQKRDSYYASYKASVQIEIQLNGCCLEVNLVTSLETQFVFVEAIRILHEEQAEVITASYNVVDATVLHTIHAQLPEAASDCGAARIIERLKGFEV